MKRDCEFTWIQFLWILLPLTFTLIVWKKYYYVTETFLSTQDHQILIDLYMSILNRNPTSKELSTHVTALDKNEYTLQELEIRLYNSDEYKRMVKTQNNLLSPEVSRMIEEREVLLYIRELYFRARSQKAEKSILLPLKDLFIYFNFNAYKFMALLRHTNYSDFEEEFKKMKNLSKESLIELYHLRFDDLKLTQDGEALRKTEKLKPLGGQVSTVTGVSSGSLSATDLESISEYLKKSLQDEMKKKIESLSKITSGETKSTMETGSTSFCTNQRYYLDPKSTVKDAKCGFSVPQKHPPICIPVGEKHSVSPVVFGDLRGASLEESKDTQVGSILPKFEFSEYLELPTSVKNCQQVPPSSKPTLVPPL